MSNTKFINIDNLSLQNILDEDAELIPLMTPEDEEEINNEDVPATLPILPLRNTVLFPGVVIPITAGRDESIRLIKEANKGNKSIGVVAQKNEATENPTLDDVYPIGTVARILKMLKMPDGNTMVVLQGKKRFKIESLVQEKPYLVANTKELADKFPKKTDTEFKAIIASIKELSLRIIKENPNLPSEASFAIKNIQSDSFLINFISSNLNLDTASKQELLNIHNLKDRALATLKKMNKELQRLQLSNDIQSKVREDMDQQQREYYLHQQMKTIQEELGGVSYDEEMEEMQELAKKEKMEQRNWAII
jgi:ATP-dependent Lon protease